MQITQLVYYSRNRIVGDDRALLAHLRDILAVSQRNNQRDGITGYLVFDKTWFLQILEGDRKIVASACQRIQKDTRHANVTVLETRDVPGRSFGQWSMGGAMRGVDQQEIYLRHGIGGALDPTRLTASAIVALARDLQGYEVTRRESMRLAG